MKKSTYVIRKKEEKYSLQLFNENKIFMLESKNFDSYKSCKKFLDILRVHLYFQTNFSRSKNRAGQFGFEIRTCWDELIASSSWFSSREERESFMSATFKCSKNAVLEDTPSIYSTKILPLQEVA